MRVKCMIANKRNVLVQLGLGQLWNEWMNKINKEMNGVIDKWLNTIWMIEMN
jgi:hypothetical protein